MNHVLQGTVPHLEPRHLEPLKRSAEMPMRPEARTPSIATGTRRLALSRILAALSRRRPPHGHPAPSYGRSAGSGASPHAIGATRGVALLNSSFWDSRPRKA